MTTSRNRRLIRLTASVLGAATIVVAYALSADSPPAAWQATRAALAGDWSGQRAAAPTGDSHSAMPAIAEGTFNQDPTGALLIHANLHSVNEAFGVPHR